MNTIINIYHSIKVANRTTIPAIVVTLISLLLLTCQKPDRDNPWDPGANLDPNAWAPKNLTIEDVSITSKKLTWHYDGDQRVEGFAIDRKQGNGNWQTGYMVLPKEARQFTDVDILPDTALKYTYSIYAYAGQNSSATLTAETKPVFPAPTNLTAEIHSPTRVTLRWQYAATGHQGFTIARKINNYEWQTGFATTATNILEHTDNTISFPGNEYLYSIKAHYGTYASAGLEFQLGRATVTTAEVFRVDLFSALAGGQVVTDGGFAVTARGAVWSTSQNPTIETNCGITSNGTGTGSFTSNLTGLTIDAIYYVRAYATNSAGTSYGEQRTFTNTPVVIDADGNSYNVIFIGSQIWMAENLKTTKYRDGSNIPNVTDINTWAGLSTPAYCWYNNDITNKPTYGALYNWYTVNTGNLCPIGWHVPTDAEWYTMENYVDPTINNPNATGDRGTNGGTKLKATSGWYSNGNGNGTDNYGFSALPGGLRYGYGAFVVVSYYGFWWSSTQLDATNVWSRSMSYDYRSVYRGYYDKRHGFSVRCIKEN